MLEKDTNLYKSDSSLSRRFAPKRYVISQKWNAAVATMYDQCQKAGPTYCLPVYYEQLVLQVSDRKRMAWKNRFAARKTEQEDTRFPELAMERERAQSRAVYRRQDFSIDGREVD